MALEREKTFDGYVTEKVDVLKSNLLGDYNAEGKYMISQAIVTELVNIKKYKRNAFNNAVYCVSQSKVIGEILFEIIFKKNTKGQVGSATLSILEPVKKINGYVKNTLKTPIAIYKAGISSTFVDDASRSFNIILNMGEGDEFNSEKLDEQIFIQAKKDLNRILGVNSYSEYNALYKEYFEQRMETIKSLDNPFMKEILTEFESEKEKIKNFFLDNNDAEMEYKTLNELLDKIMEWYFGISPVNKKYEDEYRNHILPFMRAFIVQAAVVEKTAKLDTPKSFPKNKKDVMEKTLQDVQAINEDKTSKDASPKVIDKSPDAQVEAEKKPIVKDIKEETKNPLENIVSRLRAANERVVRPSVTPARVKTEAVPGSTQPVKEATPTPVDDKNPPVAGENKASTGKPENTPTENLNLRPWGVDVFGKEPMEKKEETVKEILEEKNSLSKNPSSKQKSI